MNEMTDVEYLKTEFEKFRRLEITVNELCEHDFIKLDGPPQSGDERIARLADANGFDGNLFRDLFAVEPLRKGLRDLREKICILPRLIAKIETELPPADAPAGLPTLTKNQRTILEHLDTCQTAVTQVDIEAATDIARSTISRDLKFLREYGFTKTIGERKGTAITPEGKAFLSTSEQ